MGHDDVDADLAHQHDVAGKGRGQGVVAHRMAAVFHHDRLAGVAAHIGQRFR